MSGDAEAALVDTFRDEWPRLVALTMRIVGDLQAAEDVVQETLVAALDQWPIVGVPHHPAAWLITACRNRARNVVRDADRARQRARAAEPLATRPDDVAATTDAATIVDDRLRLMVFCCHPALPVDAQIALTLRMVAGLTTEEIARGFHESVATTAQRLVRGKRTLAEHRSSFTDDPVLEDRLPAVLQAVYLTFNEGYLPGAGEQLTRGDLAAEAHRLARLLTDLAPAEPDVWALRALLSFPLSRWSTRTDADGLPVTLEAQDRSRWNAELIAEGTEALRRMRALARPCGDGPRSPFAVQAELAGRHALAASFAETDWSGIVALYDELLRLQPTSVVALNRAVAVAMASGPETALPLLDELVADPALSSSHRPWSVRADMHRRVGATSAALADYDRALQLVGNEAERRYLAEARHRATQTEPGS